ncbi:hypothetical protein JRQ81_014730 [Phrynocephalus forsythii]|uniref:G protein gamma domain-containing protein n=1 Tax=Phrynocephalus forsythii TaxID=171643 RepID=A0A9Q1B3S8_9SAUR|nr:hypothetical protein JRQ81_014730 [Phrynocephalus forsythii]
MSGSSSVAAMKKVVQQLRLEASVSRVKVRPGEEEEEEEEEGAAGRPPFPRRGRGALRRGSQLPFPLREPVATRVPSFGEGRACLQTSCQRLPPLLRRARRGVVQKCPCTWAECLPSAWELNVGTSAFAWRRGSPPLRDPAPDRRSPSPTRRGDLWGLNGVCFGSGSPWRGGKDRERSSWGAISCSGRSPSLGATTLKPPSEMIEVQA